MSDERPAWIEIIGEDAAAGELAGRYWTGFYNHERLHESRKDVPPVEYELDWLARIRDNHHGQEQDHRLAG